MEEEGDTRLEEPSHDGDMEIALLPEAGAVETEWL